MINRSGRRRHWIVGALCCLLAALSCRGGPETSWDSGMCGAIKAAGRVLDDLRPPDGSIGLIDLVMHMPGSVVTVTFHGIRTGIFSKRGKILQIWDGRVRTHRIQRRSVWERGSAAFDVCPDSKRLPSPECSLRCLLASVDSGNGMGSHCSRGLSDIRHAMESRFSRESAKRLLRRLNADRADHHDGRCTTSLNL